MGTEAVLQSAHASVIHIAHAEANRPGGRCLPPVSPPQWKTMLPAVSPSQGTKVPVPPSH